MGSLGVSPTPMTQLRKITLGIVIACVISVIPASAQASDEPNARTGNCVEIAFAQLDEQGTLQFSRELLEQWFEQGTPFDRTTFITLVRRHGTLFACYPLPPDPMLFGTGDNNLVSYTLSYDPVTLLDTTMNVTNQAGSGRCAFFDLIDQNGTDNTFGPFLPGTTTSVDISGFGDHLLLRMIRRFSTPSLQGPWYFDFQWTTGIGGGIGDSPTPC